MKFMIDNSGPKIEALIGEDGLKKYQVVQRGTECYTYPFYDRFNFFGLRLDYVADPEPGNPLTTYSCKAGAYILPVDLVPCQDEVIYVDFETEFKFRFGSAIQPFDKIRPFSYTKYRYSYFRFFYISKVAIPNTIKDYFDDKFMEMLVCQPPRQEDATYQVRFWKTDFFRLKNALGSYSKNLKPGVLLKRLTFDSLPGYV